ncbi:MAG: hypothetical protein K2M81_05220 [Lachnospiraceae bacterium]|nr:hypothetical protein [Lachnospiraceae bacterium]
MDYKKSFWLYIICICAGGVLALIFSTTEEAKVGLILGIIVMILGLIQLLMFYRCPNCYTFLPRGIPKYCPKCGHKLDS